MEQNSMMMKHSFYLKLNPKMPLYFPLPLSYYSAFMNFRHIKPAGGKSDN